MSGFLLNPNNPGGGGGAVSSVTGLNTDNTDPANPIVQISVDGITVTGAGTPTSPLVAVGGGSGTVTSVAISGSDGLEVDSGSPITTNGTIALGVNKTALLSHINVEDGAEVNTIDTVSDTSEIDLTITARALSASIVSGSIDESKLDTSVNASLDLADTAVQPATLSSYQLTSEKNAVSGYAGLDGSGKINPSQLPAIAVTDTFVVASQVAMLALTAETGDVAVRTDLNKSFILQGTNPATLGDWQELLTPTSTVASVFGRTGVVTAQNGDYTASQVTNAFDKTADDTDDITVGTTNKFATASEKTKLGFISVTQAVDLDTMESNIATNNAKVTNATHTGDATGSTALTVVKINGTQLSSLATGILKNTTGTGVPSIAVAGDFPTLNQNTTGTASNVTGTVAVANGGTGATSLTANNVILGNGTSAVQVVAPGTSGNILTSNGTTWQSTAPAGGGTWENLGSSTLGSASNSITVTLSSSKKYLWIEAYFEQSPDANVDYNLRFNGDTGTNYVWRQNKNGTGTTGVTVAFILLGDNHAYEGYFNVYSTSLASVAKIVTSQGVQGVRSFSAPDTLINSGVWNNTSAQITSVTIFNTRNANAKYGVGSKITVYGHD